LFPVYVRGRSLVPCPPASSRPFTPVTSAVFYLGWGKTGDKWVQFKVLAEEDDCLHNKDLDRVDAVKTCIVDSHGTRLHEHG
jgi:hypothetical protein